MSIRVDRAQQRSLEPYLSPDTFLDRIDKVVVEPQLGHGGTLETWGKSLPCGFENIELAAEVAGRATPRSQRRPAASRP